METMNYDLLKERVKKKVFPNIPKGVKYEEGYLYWLVGSMCNLVEDFEHTCFELQDDVWFLRKELDEDYPEFEVIEDSDDGKRYRISLAFDFIFDSENTVIDSRMIHSFEQCFPLPICFFNLLYYSFRVQKSQELSELYLHVHVYKDLVFLDGVDGMEQVNYYKNSK